MGKCPEKVPAESAWGKYLEKEPRKESAQEKSMLGKKGPGKCPGKFLGKVPRKKMPGEKSAREKNTCPGKKCLGNKVSGEKSAG